MPEFGGLIPDPLFSLLVRFEKLEARIAELEKGMEHLGSYNYLAVVAGGIGPDVWDKEIEIQASSIGEAVRIIEDDLQSDVRIISIEQTE